jgi:hypothetical protein
MGTLFSWLHCFLSESVHCMFHIKIEEFVTTRSTNTGQHMWHIDRLKTPPNTPNHNPRMVKYSTPHEDISDG